MSLLFAHSNEIIRGNHFRLTLLSLGASSDDDSLDLDRNEKRNKIFFFLLKLFALLHNNLRADKINFDQTDVLACILYVPGYHFTFSLRFTAKSTRKIKCAQLNPI